MWPYEPRNPYRETIPWTPRRPLGTDQQGRYPEAAEAATDVGQEDPREGSGAIVVPVLTLILALAATLLALHWSAA